nr:RICIN domain-containing protein [Streptomyces sp. NBC_01001]
MRKHTRARRLLTVPTVLLAGSLVLLPDAAVAQATAPASPARTSGTFQLVNAQTGKCATIAGGVSAANNLQLVQFTCDTHPSRRWRIPASSSASNQIINLQTGKCATVAGGVSAANNLQLVQFTCDTHPSRRWRITNRDSSGSVQLVNVQTGKCATVAGGVSRENNLQLVQFTCDTHPLRRWFLRTGVPID